MMQYFVMTSTVHRSNLAFSDDIAGYSHAIAFLRNCSALKLNANRVKEMMDLVLLQDSRQQRSSQSASVLSMPFETNLNHTSAKNISFKEGDAERDAHQISYKTESHAKQKSNVVKSRANSVQTRGIQQPSIRSSSMVLSELQIDSGDRNPYTPGLKAQIGAHASVSYQQLPHIKDPNQSQSTLRETGTQVGSSIEQKRGDDRLDWLPKTSSRHSMAGEGNLAPSNLEKKDICFLKLKTQRATASKFWTSTYISGFKLIAPLDRDRVFENPLPVKRLYTCTELTSLNWVKSIDQLSLPRLVYQIWAHTLGKNACNACPRLYCSSGESQWEVSHCFSCRQLCIKSATSSSQAEVYHRCPL